MKCPFAPPGLSCNYDHIFSDRNDEKVACQKILDKIGLQGYQVKHTELLSMYQILTYIIIYSLSPEIQGILVCPKSNCSKFDQVYRKE